MKIFNYIFLSSVLFLSISCTEDFQEINTNPNAPVDVQPNLLLRKVIFDYGEQMSYEGFVAGNLLGQLFTAIDFNLFDRHSLTEPQFGGNPWDILYSNLRDNEIILEKSRNNIAFAVYEGPALIMKAYLTAALTDLYGDVPYLEALKGKDGNVTPSYDTQEAIYNAENGILDHLNQAIELLQSYNGISTLEGDILFNGNLDAWITFANSLKIKALMRISERVEVSSELQIIYESGRFMHSSADDAIFNFTTSAPNNFRMSTARIGDFNLFIMSETMEEILETLNDPRRAVFFRPTSNDPNSFKGLLNGPDASQLSISLSDFSLSGKIFRESAGNLKANFLTSWEVHFLLAEAAEKEWINASAQELYETGVKQAFAYWNTTIPDDYLTQGPAAYQANGANPIQQIITQKWLANITNGYEGWIEYRRTGYPALKTISASLNNDLIPVRMPYPTTEDALNNTHYAEAAQATGGNSVNAKVWWDVD